MQKVIMEFDDNGKLIRFVGVTSKANLRSQIREINEMLKNGW